MATTPGWPRRRARQIHNPEERQAVDEAIRDGKRHELPAPTYEAARNLRRRIAYYATTADRKIKTVIHARNGGSVAVIFQALPVGNVDQDQEEASA
jgi:hypothetical protein